MKGLLFKVLLITLGTSVPAWAVYHYIINPPPPAALVSKTSASLTWPPTALPTALTPSAAPFASATPPSSPKEAKAAVPKEIFSKSDFSKERSSDRRDLPSLPPPPPSEPTFQGPTGGSFFPFPLIGSAPQNSPLGIPRAGGEFPSFPSTPPSTNSSPSPTASSSPPQNGSSNLGAGGFATPLISKSSGNNSSTPSGSQGNQNRPTSSSTVSEGPSLSSGPSSSDSSKNSNSSDNGSNSKQTASVTSSDGQGNSGSPGRERKAEKSRQTSGTGTSKDGASGDGSTGNNANGNGGNSSPSGGSNTSSNSSSGSNTSLAGNSTDGNPQPQALRTEGTGKGTHSGAQVMSLFMNTGDPTEPTLTTNESGTTEVASNTAGSADSPGGFGRQDHGVGTDFTVHAHVSVAPPGQNSCTDGFLPSFTNGVPTVKVIYSDGQTNQSSTNKWGKLGVDLNKPTEQWDSAQFSVAFTDENGTLYNGRLSPNGERTKTVSKTDVDPTFCFYLVSIPTLKKSFPVNEALSTIPDNDKIDVRLIPLHP